MSKQNIIITYHQFKTSHELNADQLNLLAEAERACTWAYSKYSGFSVGAALLLENGQLITGCNQENASYPCGICAERAALFQYGNLPSKSKIIKMAVAIKTERKLTTPTPCGLCRQVMVEFEHNNNNDIQLILGHHSSPILVFASLKSLMPFPFDGSLLPGNRNS